MSADDERLTEVRQGAAALLSNPDLAPAQQQRLLAINAEADAARQVASMDAQRARLHARADAARASERRVRVHPATHPGPCPPPGDTWVSVSELLAIPSNALWHLDVDQERLPGFPAPVMAAAAAIVEVEHRG